jgi:hypothetical protein
MEENTSPSVSIRVHPWLKMPDFPVFRPGIAIFHRKTALNGPKTAFSAPFSPARPVAARFLDHFLPEAYSRNDKARILQGKNDNRMVQSQPHKETYKFVELIMLFGKERMN